MKVVFFNREGSRYFNLRLVDDQGMIRRFYASTDIKAVKGKEAEWSYEILTPALQIPA